jgi:hypothetical protein
LDLSGLSLRIDGRPANLDPIEREGGLVLHTHAALSKALGEVVQIEVDEVLPAGNPFVNEKDGLRRLICDEIVVIVHGKAEKPRGR